jgi:hypothetical protein
LSNLSKFLEQPTDSTAADFVLAYNRSTSYATSAVLKECDTFLEKMKIEWKWRHSQSNINHYNALISALERDDNRDAATKIFKAIRDDINPENISWLKRLLHRSRHRQSDIDFFKIYLGKQT